MKKMFLDLKSWMQILVILFVLWIIRSIVLPTDTSTVKNIDDGPVIDSATLAKEKIEKLFSPYDGSLRSLEKVIKKSMNDPDSYEHEETRYWVIDKKLVVATSFRGKNAFGGVVKNYVKARVDFDGNVLEIIEQGK